MKHQQSMSNGKRYAVITPYFQEDRSLLERCIRSVRAQTEPATHILVADGFPQPWIDEQPVRHIKLDRNYGDYGSTPRALGALLAVAEGYDGIGFLDADNWFETNHVALCIEASRRSDRCDYVIAQRNYCRPDGSIIQFDDGIPLSWHVDTSCFFLLPGSYHIIPYFVLIPKALAQLCDRIFYRALQAAKLKAEIVTQKTVNYHCLWELIYRGLGESPPPNAKGGIERGPIIEWLRSLSPRELEILHRRCGSTITWDGHSPVLGLYDAPAGKPVKAAQADAFGVKLQHARQLHRESKFDEAAALYKEILSDRPDDADALHFFGVLHAQRGTYTEAIEFIGRSLAVAPANGVAHYNMGKVLRDADRPKEALASFERATELLPDSVDAWSNRATLLQELERPLEAIASFERALTINPSHVPSLNNRASALRDLQRHEEALADYDRILELEPDNAVALKGRAAVFQSRHRVR